MAKEEREQRPLTFRLAFWWGAGFSAVFILYGAVTLVLGFLDRQYNNLAEPFVFLLIGIALISVAYAYVHRKRWGWYGEIAVNGLIILFALIGFKNYANIILLVLAAGALVLLLSNRTKVYLFGGR